MKNNFKAMAVIAAMLLFNFKLKAQVTHLGNNLGIPADYIGWDAAQLFPLTIQHLGTAPTQPINFLTGGTQRMIITNGTGLTSGFVGIGDGFSTPQNLLHVNGFATNNTGFLFRTDGSNTIKNIWQIYTGTDFTLFA